MATTPVSNREELMGQVFADFTVSNSLDIDLIEEGARQAGTVRTVELKQVLLDTGATHLCLPAPVIARLGLRLGREVQLETAAGTRTARIFRNALVSYDDRQFQGECIEVPDGVPPLIGAIVMESMGIEPDLKNRTVRKLPMDDRRSYMTAYRA